HQRILLPPGELLANHIARHRPHLRDGDSHKSRRIIAQAHVSKQLPQSRRFAMMQRMPDTAVVICVAIQLEADAVVQALGLTFDTDRTAAHGVIANNVAVELKLIGVGASRLPVRLDATKYSLVISAGLAGALDPALRCGEVVVDGAAELLPESLCAQ